MWRPSSFPQSSCFWRARLNCTAVFIPKEKLRLSLIDKGTCVPLRSFTSRHICMPLSEAKCLKTAVSVSCVLNIAVFFNVVLFWNKASGEKPFCSLFSVLIQSLMNAEVTVSTRNGLLMEVGGLFCAENWFEYTPGIDTFYCLNMSDSTQIYAVSHIT